MVNGFSSSALQANTRLAQIDVAVNAPEAGTLKEFLANEEDTVVVGQDLARIETGGAPAKSEDKDAAPDSKGEPATPEKAPEKAPEKPEPETAPEPPKEANSGPPPEKKDIPPPQPPKKSAEQSSKQPSGPAATLGSREERKVGGAHGSL